MLSNRKIKHPVLNQALRDSVAVESDSYFNVGATVHSGSHRVINHETASQLDWSAYAERSLLGA